MKLCVWRNHRKKVYVKEKVFELLKTNLKNPKLYVGLFIILIVAVLLFPYIDANWLYYGRVEKRIEILD